MTIEDETGNANLVVFRNLFEETYRKEILQSKLIMVQGKVQKHDNVIHVIVSHCENWSEQLRELTEDGQMEVNVLALSPRDEKDGFPFKTKNKRTQVRKKVVQEELFPDARNFR